MQSKELAGWTWLLRDFQTGSNIIYTAIQVFNAVKEITIKITAILSGTDTFEVLMTLYEKRM